MTKLSLSPPFGLLSVSLLLQSISLPPAYTCILHPSYLSYLSVTSSHHHAFCSLLAPILLWSCSLILAVCFSLSHKHRANKKKKITFDPLTAFSCWKDIALCLWRNCSKSKLGYSLPKWQRLWINLSRCLNSSTLLVELYSDIQTPPFRWGLAALGYFMLSSMPEA